MGRGDWMQTNCGFYNHHFIDLGNGYIVERTKDDKAVVKSPFKYQSYSLVRSGNSSTADEALSRVGERGYDLVFKNCEHFCSEVFDGWARSQQVQRVQQNVPHFYASSEGVSIGCKIF